MDLVQLNGRNAGIAVLGKAVWQHLEHALTGYGVGIDVDFAKLTIGPYIVHTSHMVVMGMGDEDAVDLAEGLWHNLLTEVGTAVDEQTRGVGLDKCRTAQAFVVLVGASAGIALAADGRHATRCSRSKKCQFHIQLLYHVDFRIDIDAETLANVMLDGLAEGDNLGACGTAAVDEHQCLLVVNAGTTKGTAFPSTLVNHPAGRNFFVVAINRIMRHPLVLCSQLLVFIATDDGVHEEAAGIAHDLGVGQLGIADADDDVAQLLGSRCFYPPALQLGTDVAVVETGRKDRRELISHHRDEETVLPFMLETAVTIAIATIVNGDGAQLASSNLNGIDGMNQVFDLNSIGTDILNGRGSHVARNKRQVLSAIKAIAQTDIYDVVPYLTTAAGHPIALNIPPLDGRVDDNAVVVLGKQQVAATTNDDKRL